METQGFFSKPDLGGVNPEEFHNNLKFLNLKKDVLDLLQKEITFLENCISQSKTGGWSTHLNGPMNKRITELKDLHYNISLRH